MQSDFALPGDFLTPISIPDTMTGQSFPWVPLSEIREPRLENEESDDVLALMREHNTLSESEIYRYCCNQEHWFEEDRKLQKFRLWFRLYDPLNSIQSYAWSAVKYEPPLQAENTVEVKQFMAQNGVWTTEEIITNCENQLHGMQEENILYRFRRWLKQHRPDMPDNHKRRRCVLANTNLDGVRKVLFPAKQPVASERKRSFASTTSTPPPSPRSRATMSPDSPIEASYTLHSTQDLTSAKPEDGKSISQSSALLRKLDWSML